MLIKPVLVHPYTAFLDLNDFDLSGIFRKEDEQAAFMICVRERGIDQVGKRCDAFAEIYLFVIEVDRLFREYYHSRIISSTSLSCSGWNSRTASLYLSLIP